VLQSTRRDRGRRWAASISDVAGFGSNYRPSSRQWTVREDPSVVDVPAAAGIVRLSQDRGGGSLAPGFALRCDDQPAAPVCGQLTGGLIGQRRGPAPHGTARSQSGDTDRARRLYCAAPATRRPGAVSAQEDPGIRTGASEIPCRAVKRSFDDGRAGLRAGSLSCGDDVSGGTGSPVFIERASVGSMSTPDRSRSRRSTASEWDV
jgi:hypothetical protein